ncbi:serine hydrolase domain-containing protein [Saccharothrix syringae]|uniref:Class A beta-lactamase-related serine hydrolase n=1 Tax=Saccharothrix syringae TaxID=103733 RepID=A0A5Q0H337_SACSY|nr:serine hydrolase domain-containing protein [Saccharothrix syringae]QFZ20648.1 class A beta-lactamase-related serine hydrolase [Saccharothrix syringae]
MDRVRAATDWIARVLPGLLERHEVPGAQVAVLADGHVAGAAAGVLNVATGVPVTDDAVFQIGSITKVWTATLVQQLVNDGLLDLDRPVRDHLADFRLADRSAAETVTARQLLSHTAGFEGDLFTDTGTGDDAIGKYVAGLADARQVFPPGERFSYCNSGYVVLGRLVEVLRGKPFNAVLRERLVDPLGLADVATSLDEAILRRPAVGHVRSASDAVRPVRVWSMAPSTAPAGAVLAMSARDLLGFVRMHLEHTDFDAMREPQVEVPDLGMISGHWALGWALPDYRGPLVLGHTGRTAGQRAFLRVVPGVGVAVAMLTNGGNVYPVFAEVFGHLLGELGGVVQPGLPVPPAAPRPVDADRVAGTYRSPVADNVVHVDADGRTWLRILPHAAPAEPDAFTANAHELVALDPDRLIMVAQDDGAHPVIGLVDDVGDGRVRYLHTSRAIPRVPG